VTESDFARRQLPEGPSALLQIWQSAAGVELNIHYAYPLLVGPSGGSALAALTSRITEMARSVGGQRLS